MSAASHNETVIAQGVKVEGEFSAEGDVVIEGELTGSVKTSQALRVGNDAKIYADIGAQSAVISGEVQGNIQIASKLELLETCQIHGDISADSLSVAPGAKINGRITMNGGAAKQSVQEPVNQVE